MLKCVAFAGIAAAASKCIAMLRSPTESLRWLAVKLSRPGVVSARGSSSDLSIATNGACAAAGTIGDTKSDLTMLQVFAFSTAAAAVLLSLVNGSAARDRGLLTNAIGDAMDDAVGEAASAAPAAIPAPEATVVVFVENRDVASKGVGEEVSVSGVDMREYCCFGVDGAVSCPQKKKGKKKGGG